MWVSNRRQAARMILWGVLAWSGWANASQAQIVAPGPSQDGSAYGQGDQIASLEDQLINRLRATEEQQRGYIRRIAMLVRQGQLEPRLVVAVYRYSIRRYPAYPFPYFERAMRYEAGKRGVSLPPVQIIASTAGEARALR